MNTSRMGQCGEKYVYTSAIIFLLLIAGPWIWAAPLSPPPTPEETAALQDMCAIVHAQQNYFRMNYAYANSFEDLAGDPLDSNPPYLECEWTVARNGYNFTMSSGQWFHYTLNAEPETMGPRHFYVDETGFYFSPDAAAGPWDTPFVYGCGNPGPCLATEWDTIIANQASARLDLCAIKEAQWAYFEDNGWFATSFEELATHLAGNWPAPRNGYNFVLGGDTNVFTANANPVEFGVTGALAYFTDASGALRFASGADADAASDVLWEGCMPESQALDFDKQALEAMCAIVQAQERYRRTNHQYTVSFDDLVTAWPPYLDGDFTQFSHYNFTLFGDSRSYSVNADAEVQLIDTANYYVDESGVIRQEFGQTAAQVSTPVATECPENPYRFSRLRRQITENENAARENLCRIVEAQYAYYADTGCFTERFDELTTPDPPYLEPPNWAVALQGYNFVMGGDSNAFTASANAVMYGVTGNRGFFADASGTIRYEEGGDAGYWDEPLQEQCVHESGISDYGSRALDLVCAIVRAQELYFEFNGEYATTFDALTSTTPSFIDGDWAMSRLGYVFVLGGTEEQYTVDAMPVITYADSPYYFADASGTIRRHIGSPADVTDPVAEQACPGHPPLLNRMREAMAENEALAQQRLCEILAAAEAYRTEEGVYPTSLDDFTAYLDPIPGTEDCPKYTYALGDDGGTGVRIYANAGEYGVTGGRGYFVDQTGVLRQEEGADASALSEPTGVVCPVAGEGEGEGEGEAGHSADQNGDHQIGLSELLRVIQFYNSGEFHCALATEDGYAVDVGPRACAAHSSDYAPQDWKIGLPELMRLIQFYNLGGFHSCLGEGTEDGFCPGL